MPLHKIRPLAALIKFELKAFWGGPAGGAALLSFLAFCGLFFYNDLTAYVLAGPAAAAAGRSLDADLALTARLLTLTALALALAAQLVTMRAAAPWRQGGHYDFLETLPLGPGRILAGQFLAGLASLWFLLLASLPLYAGLALAGAGRWGTVLCGYLGLFFLAALFVAVGLLAAAVCRSPRTSGLATLGLLGLALALGWAAPFIEGGWGLCFQTLAFGPRLERQAMGLLDANDFLALIAQTAIALGLARLALQRGRRAAPPSPAGAWKKAAGFLALGLALAGFLAAPQFPGFTALPLAAALFFFWRYGFGRLAAGLKNIPGENKKFILACAAGLMLILAVGQIKFLPSADLGRGGFFTLRPETWTLLEELSEPVEVTVFLGPRDAGAPQARELLGRYAAASPHLKFQFVNPQAGGGLKDIPWQDDRLAPPQPGSALVKSGNGPFYEIVWPVAEETLNAALSHLAGPRAALICNLAILGEKLAADQGSAGLSRWAGDLRNRRIELSDVYWAEGAELPDGADAILLAGPRAPLGPEREAALLAYLEKGGLLMIMADPLTVALSPDFWRRLGLDYPDGLVVDQGASLGGSDDAFVLVTDYFGAPGGGANKSMPGIWPLAGALNLPPKPAPEQGRPDLSAETRLLASSSDLAWLETDPDSRGFDQGKEQAGPLILAVGLNLSGGGRLVAATDSDLAANAFQAWPGNRRFLDAAVNWLLWGRVLKPLPPETPLSPRFSDDAVRLGFWLPVLAWPLLATGLWYLFYRRRRI